MANMNRRNKNQKISKFEWVLAVLWLILLLPGLVLGWLWSGSLPLWPPLTSEHLIDNLKWVVLFILSYGILLYFTVRYLFGLSRNRG